MDLSPISQDAQGYRVIFICIMMAIPNPFFLLSLSSLSLSLDCSFSDVLPSNSLHPQGAAEKDPLLHFPSDGAAAFPLCIWDVPSPVYENDISSANVYPHTHQVSSEMPLAPKS